MPTKSEIILLAGWSCAGKTTLAKRIAQKTGLAVLENHPVMDEITVDHGYDRTRNLVQAVGVMGFARLVADELVDRSADNSPPGTVIDGCLGPAMLEQFRSCLPDVPVRIIEITTDREFRLTRMMHRLNTISRQEAVEELNFRDTFLKETGLEQVLANHLSGSVENKPGRPEFATIDILKILAKAWKNR